MLGFLKEKSRKLKKDTYTLYLVYKDSRISLWKRLFLAVVIGYAFCPLDLIPDFIPILGYLDDLILVPLGIYIALKLIPSEIIDEYRKKAQEEDKKNIPITKKTIIIILLIWILGIITIIFLLLRLITLV